MTPDIFKARRPEFTTATDEHVEFTLADAAELLDERLLGGSYDEALSCLTAHILATSPQGIAARMATIGKDGSTCYSRRLAEIRLSCVTSVCVSGVSDYTTEYIGLGE